MEPHCAVQLLGILIDNARRILDGGFGVDRAEHAFFQVIDFVDEEPVLRPGFLDLVQRTLRDRSPSGLDEGQVPRELIELAAHELRWPEFRILAEERRERFFGGSRSFAASDPAESILKALEDDWEDRDFYTRYGNQR